MYRKLLSLIPLIVMLAAAGNASAVLVAHWSLDDGSGAVARDFTGNGHDGRVGGTANWIVGKIGGALDFDGTSTYIDMDDEVVRGTWTLALWLRPRDIPYSSGYYAIMHTDAWSAGTPHVHLRANTSLFNVDTNSGPNISSTTVLQENEWYHCVYTVLFAGGGNAAQIYINGVLESQGQGGSVASYFGPLNFGAWTNNQRFYHGVMDDIRVYNHVLSDVEVLTAMQGKPWPYAFGPTPPDRGIHPDTWVTLSWNRGGYAVSHDVYLGESFDDVNGATHESGTFRGNQVSTYYVAGFPGFAYPDGLVPGTTYYWRIDEVNELHADSPWKGPVWSFTVPPKKAYNPSPADGAKFLNPAAVTLTWTAGFGAKLHTVYFGENFDTVSGAAGGPPQAPTSFTPAGPLKQDTTYYWRVDEFDGSATHKGDVWSFTTAKAGGGVKGQYHRGMNFESLVLTRIDPQINFTWGAAAPDPAVGADQFSVRWTGEVEAAFTETYTFYPRADDGVRLWVDGRQLVNAWIDQGATEYAAQIDLVAGSTYSIQMEMYENGGDAVAELRWSSPRTPKQLIPQAALSPPVKASSPNPANGAADAKMTQILTWSPGDFAASHDVYFGMDADAVKNATRASPEYKGSKPLGNESYDPGKLAWDTTYYWRIDEVNNARPDSPWKGTVWMFKTGDFLLVDNFEQYNAGDNQIWYSWHDGLGYGVPGTPGFFGGNGTGSAVGDETTASFTEQTIVHGGRQSMPVAYDNNKQGFAEYSEVELKLTAPRDWTEEGVGELSLWFRGRAGSVGSFAEAPAGTFTMTAAGADIWGNADQFHFAFKTLSGAATIVARVQSVQNTNGWAKAGVMIRETLEAGSKHAFVCVTPSNGVAFQGRDFTDGASFNTNQTGLAAPYWVRLQRDAAGNFTASHSSNGTTWQPVQNAAPVNVPMSTNVYVGLALTSHVAAQPCQAVFTNVTITGTAGPQWAHQDIGIASNAPEPLYVAVSNAAGQPAAVVHPDPAAATSTTWTEWVIPLSAFADQGIRLNDVDKIAIGLGTRGNMTTPGGAGKMYFDDIRLYRPRTP